jgi:hypothetical protein
MINEQRIVDEVVDRMDLRELMRVDEPDWREICERGLYANTLSDLPYPHANALNPGANNRGRRNDRIAALRGGVVIGVLITASLIAAYLIGHAVWLHFQIGLAR